MPSKIVFIPKGGGDIAIGGAITGATEGSVLFAGAAGILAQDNANFFWNDSNNTLILGNPTTPATNRSIHTFGNFNGIELERTDGVFGLLTVDPSGTFNVEGSGNMIWGDPDGGNQIFLDNSATTLGIGDPFGDSSDVHINVDNATGFIAMGGDTAIGKDTAPTATLQIEGDVAFKRTATAVSASTAGETIIGVTDTAAPRTITLATADTVEGQVMIIKDESGAAGTNNITVATQAAETIDGVASVDITVNHGVLRVYSDGTNWFTF